MQDTLLAALADKNEKSAYNLARKIAFESEASPDFYSYTEKFAELLAHKNSYVRTRGVILICSQSKWDGEGKIKKLLPAIFSLLSDEKPTVIRQALSGLKEVAVYRPELCADIRAALDGMDLSPYKDSMVPLILKDRQNLYEILGEVCTK